MSPSKKKGAVKLIVITVGAFFSSFVEEEKEDDRNHEYRCGNVVAP